MNEKIVPSAMQTYSLYIHPEDLRELRSDIWVDDPVPAKMKINHSTYDIDLAYRGNHIRKFKKKSYMVTFVEPAYFQQNRELHLNADYLDKSLIRSKLSFEFYHDIGVLSPSTEHVFLNINGKKSGIYVQIESVDPLFFQKRNLPLKAIYYAINSDANFSLVRHRKKQAKTNLISGYERKFGTSKEDQYLKEAIYRINKASYQDFPKEVLKYFDVETFLRWLAGVVCIQNFDGFHQNYSLYLNQQTRQFGIIPWDNEGTWGRDCYGVIMEYDYVPIYGDNTNGLIVKLLEHLPFRKQYKNIMEEILETNFTPKSLFPKIHSLSKTLPGYMANDPFLYKSIDKFQSEIELIHQYIVDRHDYLRNHLKDLRC